MRAEYAKKGDRAMRQDHVQRLDMPRTAAAVYYESISMTEFKVRGRVDGRYLLPLAVLITPAIIELLKVLGQLVQLSVQIRGHLLLQLVAD
jgi:hypothetical protein